MFFAFNCPVCGKVKLSGRFPLKAKLLPFEFHFKKKKTTTNRKQEKKILVYLMNFMS